MRALLEEGGSVQSNGQPPEIQVLIVAGIRLYSEGLAAALDGRARVQVVGVTSDPVEGLYWDREPDVVLVDTSMPQAVAAVRAILATAPGVKVVALAVSEDEDILAFAEAGVSGYLTRDAPLDHLMTVIEGVIRGEAPCPPKMTAILLKHISVLAARRSLPPSEARLTHRELEVMELVDLGLSNKEIARRLCIEVPTVKNHVHRILDKLQLSRRAEAAAWVRTNEGHRLVRLRAKRLKT
jgi:two-component system, NarL family, nitrate/nitrite response regulator NarL